MERREWDDDDGFVPPPSQRAWRHPSELGGQAYRPPVRHGTMAGRPGRAQFALAVAAGAVGSLAIATLAVLVTGAADRTTTATDDRGASGARAANAAPGFTLLSTTIADERPLAADDVTNPAPATAPGQTASTVAPLAVPAVLTLRASGDAAAPGIAAVVVDDTTLLADAADIGATTRYEAQLADGSAVSVLVEGADDATGLVRLRTRGSGGLVVSTVAGASTWLGVRCVDETAPAGPPATGAGSTGAGSTGAGSTGARSAVATTVATTVAPPVDAESTTSSPAVTAASTQATTTTAATSEPAGSSTSAATAAATRAATATTSASTTTDLVATTSAARVAKTSSTTRLASTAATTTGVSSAPVSATDVPAPSSTAAPGAPREPDAMSAAGGARAVRVRDVMDGSPAALSGILPGDVVVAIDGRPVRSMWALVLAVRRHAPGERVAVQVRRDGSPHDMTVVLGVHPGSGA